MTDPSAGRHRSPTFSGERLKSVTALSRGPGPAAAARTAYLRAGRDSLSSAQCAAATPSRKEAITSSTGLGLSRERRRHQAGLGRVAPARYGPDQGVDETVEAAVDAHGHAETAAGRQRDEPVQSGPVSPAGVDG